MTTLIVPCAGKSTRFNNRPKWAITHPSGRLLIEEAISKVDMSEVSRVIFTVTKAQLSQLNINENSFKNLLEMDPEKYQLVVIGHQTQSQPETIYETIVRAGVMGPLAIKDCDNQFRWKPSGKNSIAVKAVSQSEDIRFLQQKSFVALEDQRVVKVSEKMPISNLICVGGYEFADAMSFVEAYERASSKALGREPFITDLINEVLEVGFTADQVEEYEDWGTIEIWQNYRKKFKTFFVDVDGVLLENGSKGFQPDWTRTKPLTENIKALMAYEKAHIVVCTARPESLREITMTQLVEAGLRVDRLIMGLPHCERILINDFNDSSAPFPTASSVNIERNAENLGTILKHF